MKDSDKFKNKISIPEIVPATPAGLKVIGRLAPDEYWEWRTTIEELMHADSKIKLAVQEVRIKELETALLRRNVVETKTQAGLAKVEYNKLKLKLEKKHKVSLSDTAIEPTNFEIRLLKKENE